jgi:hypothetical protein
MAEGELVEHNSYTPPVAPVADPASRALLERPPGVTRAVQLLWAATFLGFAFGVFGILVSPSEDMTITGELIGYAVVTSIIIGVSYWIFSAIWKGRNWARILLLVLAILNMLSDLAAPALFEKMGWSMPEVTAVELVGYVIQIALTVYAIVLLFSPSARPWFASRG